MSKSEKRMFARFALYVVSTFAFLAMALVAKAEQLELPTSVKVYSAPESEADVLTTLTRGTVVPVSNKSPSGFKKILFRENGTRKIGYIRSSDLRGAAQRGGRKGSDSRYQKVAGLIVGANYQNQGSRTYTGADGTSLTIQTISGANIDYGAFFNYPLEDDMVISAFIEQKNISVSGTATLAGTSAAVKLTESLLSFGAQLEMYGSRKSARWFGGGIQVDHATAGTLSYGTASATLQGSDLLNLIFVYGAMGWDINIAPNIFFLPEVRIGGILNTTPIIVEADARARIGYAF